MEITINDNNLKDINILENKTKVRALISRDDGRILIANYGGTILLPGGSVDKDETLETAITRELQEELGIIYHYEELDHFLTINY